MYFFLKHGVHKAFHYHMESFHPVSPPPPVEGKGGFGEGNREGNQGCPILRRLCVCAIFACVCIFILVMFHIM